MKQFGIAKLFHTSRSKCFPHRMYRLHRFDDYTASYHWVIKSCYEPEWMKLLKDTDDEADKAKIKTLVDNTAAAQLRQLYISDDMTIQNDEILAKLQGKVEGYQQFDNPPVRWVNPYFLSLFLSIPRMSIDFYGVYEEQLKPIVVKGYDSVIGIIMPSRVIERHL